MGANIHVCSGCVDSDALEPLTQRWNKMDDANVGEREDKKDHMGDMLNRGEYAKRNETSVRRR